MKVAQRNNGWNVKDSNQVDPEESTIGLSWKDKNLEVANVKQRAMEWEVQQEPLRDQINRPKKAPDRHLGLDLVRAAESIAPSVQRELAFLLRSFQRTNIHDEWGTQTQPETALRALLWHEAEREVRTAKVAEDASSSEVVARENGLSLAEIRSLVEAKRLSGIETADELRIPKWQLEPDGQILPGVDKLVHTFDGSPVALALWMDRTNPILNNERPSGLLRDGRVDELVGAALAASIVP